MRLALAALAAAMAFAALPATRKTANTRGFVVMSVKRARSASYRVVWAGAAASRRVGVTVGP